MGSKPSFHVSFLLICTNKSSSQVLSTVFKAIGTNRNWKCTKEQKIYEVVSMLRFIAVQSTPLSFYSLWGDWMDTAADKVQQVAFAKDTKQIQAIF